jgi:group II intron reverse transcriptase/maturase
VYDLAKLSEKPMPEYGIPPIPESEIIDKTLIWIDAPYHAGEKTFGGITGKIAIKIICNEDWQKLLFMGQFAQAGRNTAFGFGNYSLTDIPIISGVPGMSVIKPATSILERITEPSNMVLAFNHIKENKGMPGCDGESIDTFETNLYDNLNTVSGEIKNGTYIPDALQGFLIPKPEGKIIRALAIPTVKDRVLQRAACQVLSPAIDQLLEESSFAYRKGLSRKGAAQAIRQAYNDGFRYVLESDIYSFFDNVDWDILLNKIDVLFPDEGIKKLLAAWIKQDVRYKGQRIKREKGLAQGSAISPVLANLFLDEFDEALQDDFKLVRYADDFVILCKSPEKAEQALKRVKDALKQLELEINPSKTKIVQFDDGFQYLGYLFCRSLVLEIKKENHDNQTDLLMISAEQIPADSWLTHVDLRKIKELSGIPVCITIFPRRCRLPGLILPSAGFTRPGRITMPLHAICRRNSGFWRIRWCFTYCTATWYARMILFFQKAAPILA